MLTTLRLCLEVLTRRGRWLFAGVLLLATVVALVETFAVVSIMPFISLISNPSVVEEEGILRWLYETLGYQDVSSFLVFAGMVVLGVIVLSNALAALSNWALLRFVWLQYHDLSKRLLRRYLNEPYLFFLNRNTADLSKNILSQAREVIWGSLTPGTRILSRGTTALFLLVLLLFIDWRLAIILSVVLGSSYGILYRAVRKTQARIGQEQVADNRRRFQIAAEAFGGIKEIKVKGREEELIRRFSRPSARFARHYSTNIVTGELPRYAVEAVAFGGIVLILIYLLASGDGVAEILPLASLYAFAGYKLMPALQTMFHGATQMRFHSEAVVEIHQDLTQGLWPEKEEEALPDEPSDAGAPLPDRWSEVRMEGVSFTYPGQGEPAVKDVSLTVPKGQVVGVIGATGAGKTTLVDLLLGLLVPEEGSIRVGEVEIEPGNIREWKKQVGYVPQEIFLTDDTVERNIAFALPDEDIDSDAVRSAARAAQIHDFIAGLPGGYETIVGERGVRLSGGQRQRIGLARALYDTPSLLVLDEGTSALDTITEGEVMDQIVGRSRQKSVVLVTHRLRTVENAENIYLMEEGRITAEGGWEELLTRSERFRAMTRADAGRG